MENPAALKVSTPTDCEIVMTREFDAPRTLVFEAMSDPELVKQWCTGPPGWAMVECSTDFRVGGGFRHAWRHTDGTEMAMHGIHQAIDSPERVVRTEIFEFGCDAQAGEQVSTLVLVERLGRTHLTVTVRFPSKEARDATIASGMERGAGASYDQLAELLAARSAR